MTGKTLGELFDEEEAILSAKTQVEIASETAAWNALPQSEKDRITAEKVAKWEAFADSVNAADEEAVDDEDWDEDEICD